VATGDKLFTYIQKLWPDLRVVYQHVHLHLPLRYNHFYFAAPVYESITESAVINESIVWDWRHFYVSGEDDIGAGSSDLAPGSLAAYLRGSSNVSGFLCPIRLDKF
jgi:hypothetical protein